MSGVHRHDIHGSSNLAKTLRPRPMFKFNCGTKVQFCTLAAPLIAALIVPVEGAELLGPLPGEFASTTVFTAGIGNSSKVVAEAKLLIQFLGGPVARPVLSAKGFQSG